MTELEQQGIGYQSSLEAINITTPGRKLVYHIFGALAEFERNLIRERKHAGIAAARARGRKGGRPKRLNSQQRALARRSLPQKKHSIDEICLTLGITKSTLYAYAREAASKDALTPAGVQS